MPMLIKLCDVKGKIYVRSPLNKLTKQNNAHSIRCLRDDMTLNDWRVYERNEASTVLNNDTNAVILENADGQLRISFNPGRIGNIKVPLIAGIFNTVAITPDTAYSFSVSLKLIKSLKIRTRIIIDEYEIKDTDRNYFPDENSHPTYSQEYRLKHYFSESSIVLSDEIEFESSSKTNYIIVRIEFIVQPPDTLVPEIGYVSDARLSSRPLSKEDRLAGILSKYSHHDKHRGSLDKYNAKKKKSILNSQKGVTEHRTVLVAPAPTHIRYRLAIPRDSTLEFGCTLLEESLTAKSGPVQFEVSVCRPGKKETVLYSDRIDPREPALRSEWRDASVDLSGYHGDEVSVSFKTRELASIADDTIYDKSRYCYAAWSTPVLYTKKRTRRGQNVIFISLDAMMMSHLGCYGYKKTRPSPNLDIMADNGVKFTNCITVSNWTLPSHIALLTGCYPLVFKAAPRKYVIDENTETIAELLSNEGYLTACFNGDAWWSEKSLIKGFDIFQERWVDKTKEMELNFKAITEFIRRSKNNNFFIFWHTFETHHPFVRSTFVADMKMADMIRFDYRNAESIMAYCNGVGKNEITPTAEEISCLELLLDSTIHYADSLIGLLAEELRALRILDDTIFVITADHGNALLNPIKHAELLSDDIIRVPLIMHGRRLPKGKTISSQVRTIDIAPTLLDLLGFPVTGTMNGRSLKPIMRNKDNHISNSTVFSISDMRWNHPVTISARDGRYKLLYNPGNSAHALYDLSSPDESNDIASIKPSECAELREQAQAFIFSSLPKGRYYLWFFGRNTVFKGEIAVHDAAFCEARHIFFKEAGDYAELREHKKELVFEVSIVDGFKGVCFKSDSQNCALRLAINANQVPVRKDAIFLGKMMESPLSNPFDIITPHAVCGLEIDGSRIKDFIANQACVFFYLP